MKFAVQLSLLFSLVASGFATATEQGSVKVSAQADWIAGLELKRLRESSWEYLPRLAVEKTPKAQENIDKLNKALGFRPWRDIDQVTLYGTWARRAEGVVLVQSSKDLSSLTRLISQSDGYSTSDFNGHTVHHWRQAGPDGEKIKMKCCLYQPRLAIFCRDEGLLQEATEVLDGKKPEYQLPKEAKPHDDSIFWFFLRNLHKAPGDSEQLKPFLNKTNFVAFYAGETNANSFAVLCLSTKAEKDAQEFSKIFVGMRALARLKWSDNPIAVDLVDAVQVTADGTLMKIEIEQPSKKLQGYIAALITLHSGKRAATDDAKR